MSPADLRAILADKLTVAAEIEHGVLCQYLYAALSLKKNPEEGVTWVQLERMRGWEAAILKIARQEMEHLGIVCNLLSALGGAPHFGRPPMPLPPGFYGVGARFTLEPFSVAALRRFVRLEHPADGPVLATLAPDGVALLQGRASIAELYLEIRKLVESTDDAFWLGPSSAQIVTQMLNPAPGQRTVYDVSLPAVIDQKSALAAVDQVLIEGEGTDGHRQGSHFAVFHHILEELEAELEREPGFEPARPIVANPTLDDRGHVGQTELTAPATRALARVFDRSYGVMLVMLARYYVHTDETPAELSTLQTTAFFPSMTLLIRPIAEMLTLLPASSDPSAGNAGPPFTPPRATLFLPDKRSAWRVIAEQLDQIAADCAALVPTDYPAVLRPRVQMLLENTGRMAANFRAAMLVGGDA
ncbi:MAG: hypothetical protein JNL79_39055 [Myxococcales bacterium]|nr:hypothetical protein [Myxococcales bacterium]